MITSLDVAGYEQVLRVEDPGIGLTAFIAVHSTTFGPAAGGLRMRPYASEGDAFEDALRLARGMTFKNVATDLPLGGGKAVIIGDPQTDKTPEKLLAVAEAIDGLAGAYWTAEDMGMSPEDMELIATRTEFVAGRSSGEYASGDPSPITAQGVYNAIEITMRRRFHRGLNGAHIAIQGLGHVGWSLAERLHASGASLIVADTDPNRVAQAVIAFQAEAASTDTILFAEADLLAPCAIGGVLNDLTIPYLNVGAVAGAANNQLDYPRHGALLAANGILYAPDYVANGGGIINVAAEINRITPREPWVADKVEALALTLTEIFDRAEAENICPPDAADAMIEARLMTRTEIKLAS